MLECFFIPLFYDRIMVLFGDPDPVLATINSITRTYKSIEERFTVTRRESFKDLVCPKRCDRDPLDRWYKYKEGYSSMLVHRLLREFTAAASDVVLDPFLGSGTTLAGSSSFGIARGHGIEVNPFSAMLSRVKLRQYTQDNLSTITKRIKELFTGFNEWKKEHGTEDLPALSIVKKLFDKRASTIAGIMAFIKETPGTIEKEFLLAGLGCILEQASRAKKDGNGLKYPDGKRPAPIAPTLLNQYKIMIRDVKTTNVKGTFTVHEGDCRDPSIYEKIGAIDHVIFSPPYANCFDYIEVYKMELWMLEFVKEYVDLKMLREKTISSHLNKVYETTGKNVDPLLDRVVNKIDWNDTWGGEKNKLMIENYFSDMASVIDNITSILAPGGTMTCVIGNSAYGSIPIASDLLLARVMERAGLDVTEIRVARALPSSVQQKKKMGKNRFMRESLVMAKKNRG